MLNNVRLEINLIDEELIKLFIRRIELVKKVLEYKKDNNLPITDEKREVELLNKNLSILNNPGLEKYYKVFFEGVLNSSKLYQEDNL